MPFSKTQTGVSATGGSGTTITCILGSNPTSGNIVIVNFVFYDGTTTPPTFTVSDNAGTPNVYSNGPTSGSVNMDIIGMVGQAYLLTAGATATKTVTITFNKALEGVAMWLDEFTVTSGPAIFDSSNSANGTGVINSPLISVSGSSDLVMCTAADNGDVGAAGSPFTFADGGDLFGGGPEWVVNRSSNISASYAGTVGEIWNCVGMSFKDSGSVGIPFFMQSDLMNGGTQTLAGGMQ